MLNRLQEYVRRGELAQAIELARRLLLDEDLSPSDRAEVNRLAGRARAQAGDPHGGLKQLEMAVAQAFQSKDWDTLGRARAEVGVAWLTVGDTAQALEYLQAYLLDVHRYRDALSYFGHVHYNLGLTHRRRRNLDYAISHYQSALEWFGSKGRTLQVAETHQNLAWAYCLNDQVDEASRTLEIASSFVDVLGPAYQVELLVVRSLLASKTQQFGQAMRLVHEILQPNRLGCTPNHSGNAAWIAGCVALTLGDLETVEFFAATAIRYALEANNPAIMTQAALLRKQARAIADRGDEAAG